MKKYACLLILGFVMLSLHGISQEFNKAKLDSFFSILEIKNKGMGSLAISKKGELVYQRAIGFSQMDNAVKIPATTNTRYRIGSISKMFTGVIIFQLIDENKLSLDVTIDKYFPALPNAGKITVANLLNHRSGLHSFTDDSLYYSYYEKPISQKALLAIIAASAPDFEPGKRSQYSNTNYVLLGWIAEQITKKSYKQLVEERIVAKIQLPDTYVGGKTNPKNNECYSYSLYQDWKQEPETDMSIPGAAGAIVSTPASLAKFIEALFAGKLVSAASLESMKTLKEGYGMAMFQIPFYNRKAFGHNGSIDGFGSMLAYFPGDSLSVAYCTNGQVYPMNDIIIAVLSIYFNREYTLPSFIQITFSNEELDNYSGTYSSTQMPLKIIISKDGNSLKAQPTGQPAFPLEATEKDRFKYEKAGIEIVFRAEKNEFTITQGGTTYLFTKEK